MEMQYNSLLHNRNYYVTMEIQSRCIGHATKETQHVTLTIIMDSYKGPHSSLTIALHRGLYLAFLMDRHEGTHSTPTIALLRGLHLAIIMDRYKGPTLPLL
jgi:hypothetical protein